MAPHPMAQAILRADFGSGKYEIDGLFRKNFSIVAHVTKARPTPLKAKGILYNNACH